ncbi:MAG: hypothetical protein HKN00_03010, partial [Flavobacteriaceae bacterium]|nr:hypothetical protein [Flavobacteriaceae bacterium]
LDEARTFAYPDVNSTMKKINIEKDSLVFMYCQIPIIYKIGENLGVTVNYSDNSEKNSDTLSLDQSISEQIFNRSGRIHKIEVTLSESFLK